jgi:hypothetical protein
MVLKIGMKMKYKKMPQFVFRKMRHFLVHPAGIEPTTFSVGG